MHRKKRSSFRTLAITAADGKFDDKEMDMWIKVKAILEV